MSVMLLLLDALQPAAAGKGMGLDTVCEQEVDESEESRIPRTIEVELSGDLVGCCSAGDELTVLGIVRVLSADSGGGQAHN